MRAVIDSRGSGTVHPLAMYGDEIVGQRVENVAPGRSRIRISTPGNPAWRVLMAFESDLRGTASSLAVVPAELRTR